VTALRDYAHGANRPGVYLTAPGPSRDLAMGFLPVGLAISFFFFWPLSGTGQPGNLVRLMAFDNARTLARSITLLTFYFGLIYFPLVVIFCCARLLVPGLDNDPDRIMPAMAFHLASGAGAPWLAGLLVAAPFAAAMSTVDSLMLMISSSVVRDIYQRNINPSASEKTIKRFSYLCTLLVGVVVMLGAVNPPLFLQYLIVFTSGGLSVSFLMPMALAMYWRRANRWGMLAAMLGGLAAYLSLYLAGFWIHGTSQPLNLLSLDPLIWGFAASLLCGVGVSLATPPPPDELVRRFFDAPPRPAQSRERTPSL
jgi:SSS family solute:Na+ symporter/sodium/pantothenate symporter